MGLTKDIDSDAPTFWNNLTRVSLISLLSSSEHKILSELLWSINVRRPSCGVKSLL